MYAMSCLKMKGELNFPIEFIMIFGNVCTYATLVDLVLVSLHFILTLLPYVIDLKKHFKVN